MLSVVLAKYDVITGRFTAQTTTRLGSLKGWNTRNFPDEK